MPVTAGMGPAMAPATPVSSAKPHNGVKNLAAGAIVILLIIAVLFYLQASGTFRIFPPAAPAVTPTLTPEVTSSVVVGTPSPSPTTVRTAITTLVTTVLTTPVTTTAKPVFCLYDLSVCGSNCTDLTTDESNCGTCGIVCKTGETCRSGSCASGCETGEVSCFDGCHNLSIDSRNCGTCGNTCPFGLECNRSICTPPPKTVIPTYQG